MKECVPSPLSEARRCYKGDKMIRKTQPSEETRTKIREDREEGLNGRLYMKGWKIEHKISKDPATVIHAHQVGQHKISISERKSPRVDSKLRQGKVGGLIHQRFK